VLHECYKPNSLENTSAPWTLVDTHVREMTNVTFSEEFRGCFAQASIDSCVVQRGFAAGQLRIFRAGKHESSTHSGWKWHKPEGELTLCATMLKDHSNSARSPLIVLADIRRRLRSYLQITHAVVCTNLSFLYHVPYTWQNMMIATNSLIKATNFITYYY